MIGSSLSQPSNGNRLWIRMNPLLLRRLSLTTNPTLNAVDILRKIDLLNEGEGLLDGQLVYQPLLDALNRHFVEYLHNNNRYAPDGRPERITRAGCDVNQVDRLRRKPTLFIFPYDWRKDNALSAAYLKEYIVDCIQRIHPGAKVDIVAHSMGGLLARRMILDTESQMPGPHPLVRRLITAGSPFWGAPKANYMMETGDIFGLPRVSAVFGYFNPLIQIMRVTARDFPAVHQLLPSKAFFDNAPANLKPFGEGGPGLLGLGEWRYWDINGSLRREDDYTYNTYKAMMDTDRPFSAVKPMTTNETFHSHANQFGSKQDDWGNDATGVVYYHLVGAEKNTPVKLRAMTLTAAINIGIGRFRANIAAGRYFIFEYKSGDGTVPRLSAERTRGTNAPGATLQVFKDFDHMELAAKKEALDCILKFLGVANVCQASAPVFQAGLVPASRHIALVNVQNVRTLDAAGNLIDLLGVVVPSSGETTTNLAMPAGQEAFIYFHTLSQPEMSITARVMTTDDTETYVRKTLYFDAQLRNNLPPLPAEDMLGLLYIDGQGGTRLQLDWNRDGVVDGSDAVVPPTVDSTDPGVVADELGPTIRVTGIREEGGTRYVTLDAADPSGILADTGLGTPPFLVSLENDGLVIDNLVKYSTGDEVPVPAGQYALTACVVDGAGNRLCELFAIP
jgi:pimeloyl-ACP methyl ester carboxylesterase